jgi:hypothetical protein
MAAVGSTAAVKYARPSIVANIGEPGDQVSASADESTGAPRSPALRGQERGPA